MSRLIPMSDLVADDLLLDRLAAREHAGSEPVAGLLAALADQADTPLPSRAGRRRTAHKHRYVGPFVALVVAASGAGVAAAVTLPHHSPDPAEKARIVKQMEAAARSGAPSALLSRLGLPRTTGTTEAQGLVMARRDDGVIVLVPASTAAVHGGSGRAGADGTGLGAARDGATTQGGAGQAATDPKPSGGRDGSSTTGAQGGDSQGGNEQGSGTSGAPAGGHTGATQPGTSGQKQATGDQGSGGQGKATTGSTSSSGSSGGTSGTGTTSGSDSKGGQQPTTGSTATATPSAATSPSSFPLLPVLGPDTMLVRTVSPTTTPTR